jgi:poly(A) polymerase
MNKAPVLAQKQAPWLFEGPLPRLLDLLDKEGEEARVVGGAVRNTLLGVPVSDVDVATTAVPEAVVARVAKAGFRAVPTGIEHGTVTVVMNEKPFEVTTLRQDIETDGRRATVRFGRDWKADAERRDFTINSLSADRKGQVFDYTGGVEDIAAHRVRFIGDASKRIAEDYLRVLRFFRFYAAYGEGVMDAAGLAACIQARDRLSQLSRERVRNELMKLLIGRHAVPSLAVMSETGILVDALAGVPYLASFSNMTKIEAHFGLTADATRRLGALGVRVREDVERLRERLRLTNEEAKRLRIAAEGWWQISPEMGPVARRAIIYRVGPEAYCERAMLAFSRADEKVDDESWRELLALPDEWTAPKFPIEAQDFIDRGVEKGPLLGIALAIAEASWVDHGFPEEDHLLRAIVRWSIEEARKSQGTEKQSP